MPRYSRRRTPSPYYTSSEDDIRGKRFDDSSDRGRRKTFAGRRSRSRSHDTKSALIYLSGPLDVVGSMTEDEIVQLFIPVCRPVYIKITGRSIKEGGGYAIVALPSERFVRDAIEVVDGKSVKDGKILRARRHIKGSTAASPQFMPPSQSRQIGTIIRDNKQRVDLMKSLSRTSTEHSPATDSMLNSHYISVSNLWNVGDQILHEQGEKVFFEELWNDVTEEVKKHGIISKHYINTMSDDGTVYIELSSVDSANRIVKDFNGRWFAGRTLSVKQITQLDWCYHVPKFIIDS